MTKCLLVCGKSKKAKKILERRETVKRRETRKIEEENTINWAVDEK